MITSQYIHRYCVSAIQWDGSDKSTEAVLALFSNNIEGTAYSLVSKNVDETKNELLLQGGGKFSLLVGDWLTVCNNKCSIIKDIDKEFIRVNDYLSIFGESASDLYPVQIARLKDILKAKNNDIEYLKEKIRQNNDFYNAIKKLFAENDEVLL